MAPSINKKRTISQANAPSLPIVRPAFPLPWISQAPLHHRSLPLRSEEFLKLAKKFNGTDQAGPDDEEDMATTTNRMPLIITEEEEEELAKHTPAGYEGTLAPAIDLVDMVLLQENYPRLLQSVAFGNLAFDRNNDAVLAAILDKLWDQAANQPGIYHQQLVNDDGYSPTVEELYEISKYMLGYVKGYNHELCGEIKPGTFNAVDAQLANTIDNFKADKYKVQLKLSAREPASYRAYMWSDYYVEHAKKPGEYEAHEMYRAPQPQLAKLATTGIAKGKASSSKKLRVWRLVPDRIKRTITFVNALQKRLNEVLKADWNKPLEFPLVDVGYSNECIPRLREQASHHYSNYLMALTETLCAILPTTLQEWSSNGPYHIEQAVIYLVYKPEQSEISEIGWTKLADGYIHNGGGFSHYPAGLSNASASKTSVLIWSAAMMYVVKESAMKLNAQAEIDRINHVDRLIVAESGEQAKTDAVTKQLEELLLEEEAVDKERDEARTALFTLCEKMSPETEMGTQFALALELTKETDRTIEKIAVYEKEFFREFELRNALELKIEKFQSDAQEVSKYHHRFMRTMHDIREFDKEGEGSGSKDLVDEIEVVEDEEVEAEEMDGVE
ncbi:hypothetical protein TUN205_04829 [Pyrenophora tritici-repentis]|nr:hypothetical protein TUN205_04829 [Pyrenophora tritici-repentis]